MSPAGVRRKRGLWEGPVQQSRVERQGSQGADHRDLWASPSKASLRVLGWLGARKGTIQLKSSKTPLPAVGSGQGWCGDRGAGCSSGPGAMAGTEARGVGPSCAQTPGVLRRQRPRSPQHTGCGVCEPWGHTPSAWKEGRLHASVGL